MKNILNVALLGAALSVFSSLAVAQESQLDLIAKGKLVATAADCQACHTNPEGGRPFSGDYAIHSPMGTIYTTNITPSKQFGIGNYTLQQFSRAVREGVRPDGENLYPAMPYTSYSHMSDEDIQAMYAYFQLGVKPVEQPTKQTALPFPFNMRIAMAGWNMMYLDSAAFKPDATKSAEWNRGAYLVNGAGHCDTCHTPRNLMMGSVIGQPLAGGMVGPWYAPNISSDPVSGIGNWSQAQLVEYLKTGRTVGKNQAAGPMAEAVQNSLQYLPDADLNAIAFYLKNAPAVRDPADKQAADSFGSRKVNVEEGLRGVHPSNANNTITGGAALFSGYCASCHQPDGGGSKNQAYPSLYNNTATGLTNASNLISTILYGVDRQVGDEHVLMPKFGEGSYVAQLTDAQIADISNYVLTNFGNPQIQVTTLDVAVLRGGGPVTLLAKLQPYMAPAMVIGVIVVLALIFWLFRRRQARQKLAHADK
ncbi:cytochrome c [Rouxiella sp. T17]|uniref:cytochrome c n=1 Tax=Rouxiella sp. T17 TaxID=3085684 RepID=UPI002FC5E528